MSTMEEPSPSAKSVKIDMEEQPTKKRNKNNNTKKFDVAIIILVTILGGINAGYHLFISDVITPLLRNDNILNAPFQESFFKYGSISVGCIIGSIVAGYLCDLHGRKQTLIYGEWIMFLSLAFLQIGNVASIMIFRIIQGIGIGMCNLAIPLYISEVIRKNIRGAILVTFSTTTSLGMLLAFLFQIQLQGGPIGPGTLTWRDLNWVVIAIPVLMYLFTDLIYHLPKSQEWLDLIEKDIKESNAIDDDSDNTNESLASASSQPSSSPSEKNKWYYCSKEGSFCNTKGKIGEFIFDRNALYMHHGCNLDFSIYRPHSIGDEIFFNLPDRSHHSKLIVIRSWLSVGYYHLLTEAAPRIMYVLELLQKDPTIQLLIDPAIYNSPNGIRRPDKELFLELLEIRKNQIVEYDEAVVYSADILFVPSGTPCENTAPALIRDWSQLLREKQKQRQNYNLQHNNRNNIVVIIRANVISHKGEQFTDDVLKNMRSHDDMLRSEILIQKLKTRFGDKYPIKRFYGNITLMETSKLFASAIAVIGRSGAGFSNLIFAEPSTVVMMVIANRVLEYCVYQNKNILSSSQHIGLALKLGMIPRMIIAENLAGNDGASYPYATVVNELESVLG
eukprot:g12850.t1